MTELDVALEAARAAAAILSTSKGPQVVEYKGSIDLVTEVDRACESAVREVLTRHTPEIPILGEEEGGAWEAATRWVIDPLDGTTNFVHGFPFYAVSVALEVEGKSRVGVVIDPVRHREFTASLGQGAHCNGDPIRVSRVDVLSQALVATGFPYDRVQNASTYVAVLQRVLQRAQGIRRAGAAALDLAMVACGSFDAYWESNLSPWDVAAGHLLVEEAGGVVSGHDGSEMGRRKPSPLATNGRLHHEMSALICLQEA